jgi:hypothetical protein
VHFREILYGYFLFSRFDWSIFVTQLVAKHMKEIITFKILQICDKMITNRVINLLDLLFHYFKNLEIQANLILTHFSYLSSFSCFHLAKYR